MNTDLTLCPLCGEGHLVEHTHDRNGDIDGFRYVVRGLRHSLCDHCGETITTPEQSRHNKRVIIEARDRAVAERNRVERLIPADILRIRKKLGLTQVQAARVFGGGTNAFGKYENGDVAPSDGMEKLLRLADTVPEAAAWLFRRAGLPAPSIAQTPCLREKDCVVLRRLQREVEGVSMASDAKTSFATLMGRRPAVAGGISYCYTYSSATAANDSEAHRRPELTAVG
jgi:HTH-type transcriptional regulator/antitoxin MqsA